MKDSSYRQYFDIDPDYFPVVNADVIKNNPDLWKKFFPHKTFIRLIKDTVDVLNRKQKKNIWVEGAYGTGKSHAALTLKHLIDATSEETKAYFQEFHLDNDLLNKFLAVKSQGKVLTVHRYASSSIHGDNDLFLALQESIEKALKNAGIENRGATALKDSVIRYLSDAENKESFGVYIRGSYAELFDGDSVDDIIFHLKTYEDDALQSLMGKIFRVAHKKQIRAFVLSSDDVCDWINSVIENNHLLAIVFIWDEFTEFFKNNYHSLTGFQEILEKTATAPFCFIPVTHQSDALFPGADSKTKNKILDRFILPTSRIELPENMAFQLMGQAMKKTDDPAVLNEWDQALDDLKDRTSNSRKQVSSVSKVSDSDLCGILPIHPYAAVVLKHISTSFASNQRSMFDFIKNDDGEDMKGFQWFIDNYSDMDDNPLLTIDMLWGFFYERGKENLAHGVRQILDYYPRLANRKLTSNEDRVLKVILLLQAMSMEVNDSVELFIPNDKNLNLAFEGSDIDNGAAARCAEKLVKDNIVYKKGIGSGEFQYSILTGDMDSGKIDELKKNFADTTTAKLIDEGNLSSCVEIPESLKKRCIMQFVGISDLDKESKIVHAKASEDIQHIYCIVSFAKDESESVGLAKKIKDFIRLNPETRIVFIDCGKTPLSIQDYEDWITNKATSSYYTGKDNSQAQQYNTYATDILNKWRSQIKNGAFVVYSKTHINGDSKATIDALQDELFAIDRKIFPYALEFYSVNASMWTTSSLKQGVECGVSQDTKGLFRTSVNSNKLENALANAWLIDNYWETSPSLSVSKMKIAVNKRVDTKIAADARISIKEIYEMLKSEPFGFMPCNISAFFIGFLMKEFINSGTFSWSDDISSDELSLDKFKEMVDEVIKLDITPNSRYREKYLVAMTPEEKSFLETTAEAFDLSKNLCSSLEQARERVRSKMKEYSFPLWTLDDVINDILPNANEAPIKDAIKLYCNLANSVNTGKTDSDIAIEIGSVSLNNESLKSDLRKLINRDNCISGMQKYIARYKSGELINLASKIKDDGQYINALRKKFDADAANWVWKEETVNSKIDELILEYQIASATSDVLGQAKSYDDAINAWRDKCSRFKLPYQAIKDEIGAASALFDLLYILVRDGRIQDSKRADFLNAIGSYGKDFVDIYNNRQQPLFEKVFSFYLQDLSANDIMEIFHQVHTNTFTSDKADYSNKISNLVAEHKKQMGSQRLKNLWREKTETDSPWHWSKLNNMPILAMMSLDEESDARKFFSVINNANASSSAVEEAIAYLESAKFFDRLKDESARVDAFKKRILKSYAVVLTDIDSVKNYLSSHITDAPYQWLGSQAVEHTLRSLAESTYNKQGHIVAEQKIDSMGADDVKRYLKELIKNNMTVGIEIIKNN
jgi:hypothetical protein